MSDRPYTAGRKYEVVDRDELHDKLVEHVHDPGVYYDSWQENGIPDEIVILDWEEFSDEENGMYHELLFVFPNNVETEGGAYKHELDNLEEAGLIEHIGFRDMS